MLLQVAVMSSVESSLINAYESKCSNLLLKSSSGIFALVFDSSTDSYFGACFSGLGSSSCTFSRGYGLDISLTVGMVKALTNALGSFLTFFALSFSVLKLLSLSKLKDLLRSERVLLILLVLSSVLRYGIISYF